MQAAKHVVCEKPEMSAGRRKGGSLCTPDEQRCADPVLEGTDASAKGRLGDVADVSGGLVTDVPITIVARAEGYGGSWVTTV
jgi:hypothetical protein